jgi:hypothetical protein
VVAGWLGLNPEMTYLVTWALTGVGLTVLIGAGVFVLRKKLRT